MEIVLLMAENPVITGLTIRNICLTSDEHKKTGVRGCKPDPLHITVEFY
jgi:hypothetical protein